MTARTLPLPGEFDNMSTPVIISGQRRWNSSSVVDTSSFRSKTPRQRSVAYLLLFIHL